MRVIVVPPLSRNNSDLHHHVIILSLRRSAPRRHAVTVEVHHRLSSCTSSYCVREGDAVDAAEL